MGGGTDVVPVKVSYERITILDQTKLPKEEKFLEINTKEDVFVAIKKMKVRGAPAIGIAAAYGLFAAVRDLESLSLVEFKNEVAEAAEYIVKARPTAVNLSWALKRMMNKLDGYTGNVKGAKKLLFNEAEFIRKEDEKNCRAMGEHGLTLLKKDMGILTHCNAGTLATARYGTSLSPLYLGNEKGYDFKVFVDETRPLLQGARLTAWELKKSGIDVTLICDSMAAQVMKSGMVDAVIVGCDRMATHGDGANKIGTFMLAVLAKEFDIPFYMFVPTSTIDPDTESGDDIEIELRDGSEITDMWYKERMAPQHVKTYNPSFDVTPAEYITAIVTEKGVIRPPYDEKLKGLCKTRAF